MTTKAVRFETEKYETLIAEDDDQKDLDEECVDLTHGRSGSVGPIQTTLSGSAASPRQLLTRQNTTIREEECYELPRDILVAYLIIKILPDFDEEGNEVTRWDRYDFKTKLGVYIALITTFLIQTIVVWNLFGEVDWSCFGKLGDTEDEVEIMYNVVCLAVLFIFLLHDSNSYYRVVWTWLGRIEEQQQIEYNPLRISRLKKLGDAIRKRIKKLSDGEFDARREAIRWQFIHFRIFILLVFALYLALAVYSTFKVMLTVGLDEKLDVALKMFFILSVDDWACGLFIIQNGVLEESDFDRTMVLKVDNAEDKLKRDCKYLWWTLAVFFGTIGFIMIVSIVYHVYEVKRGSVEDCMGD